MKSVQQKNNLVYVRQRMTDGVFAPHPFSKAGAYIVRGKHPAKLLFFVFAVATLLTLSLGNVGHTLSYFIDQDASKANVLSAGSLDFSISSDGSVEAYIGSEAGGGKVIIPVVTPTVESFDLRYRVTAEKQSGSNAFCNAIIATATTSPFIYSGPLLSISTGATTTVGAWPLALSLSGDAIGVFQGDVCYVDLVYRGWRDGANEGEGYRDEERVHLALHARMIVINEFLPNPEGQAYGINFGDDFSLQPQGEWVELYNNSAVAVNLSGFYIWDESGLPENKVPIIGANTQFGATTIPAHGWLVVYMNKEILDNDADEIRLYSASDVLVDMFIYGNHEVCEHEPTAGAANAISSSGGTCDPVPPNKSYARIPDGLGAHIDPIPTAGYANTLSEAELSVPAVLIVEIIDENVSTTLTTSTPEIILESVSSGGEFEEPVVLPILEEEQATSTPTEIISEHNSIVDQAGSSTPSVPEPIPESTQPVETQEVLSETFVADTIPVDVPEALFVDTPVESQEEAHPVSEVSISPEETVMPVETVPEVPVNTEAP